MRHGLPPPGGIVVGADDGRSAHGAVIWAARAAWARRLPVVVCHAYQPTGGRELECAARNRAWRTATYAAEIAQAEAPGVEAVPWVAEGSPSQVLVGAVKDPELIVVGFRSRGRLAAELVSSLGERLDLSGPCPIVAVPSRIGGLGRNSPGRRGRGTRRTGRVVVATAVYGDNDEVLRFASDEADRWGAHVVEVPVPWFGPGVPDAHESLLVTAKDADLLVMGRAVGDVTPTVPFLYSHSPTSHSDGTWGPPPPTTLAGALGWVGPAGETRGSRIPHCESRRVSVPVAVVPVTERAATTVGAGTPTGTTAALLATSGTGTAVMTRPVPRAHAGRW
ncbi:universal stress protein [Actinopolymorpha alba]|uniref:universal stress protein n=1 Tax=Actinopolymorpha alba TaxID=533267 RepID=UPI0012F6A3CC|nr:universal stress protein [Actinopolymorpha alba]